MIMGVKLEVNSLRSWKLKWTLLSLFYFIFLLFLKRMTVFLLLDQPLDICSFGGGHADEVDTWG